ncbi:MAG TPA: HAD family phosphatase [Solirubrobacteraceae bacterium]|nr:HAD family phosphatase [Solirubrobacteraceae bacterium]
MISAVISDFGGVLTKPLMNAFNRVQDDMALPIEAYGPAFAHSLEHDGVHPLFALERGEISEPEFMARLERGFAAVLGREVSLHGFGEQLMAAMEPNQELFDHYALLRREHDLRFALCTNNVREWEARWRALLPIDELFEVVVDSAFVGARKPEPEIYAITLERLGVPAEACVFIDDLEPNVDAAKTAGMHGIVHRDTAQTIAELEGLL